MQEEEKTAHIAVLQTPGMGHLIPLVEFSKRLIKLEPMKISVTLIIPTTGPLDEAQKIFLESLPGGISYVALPPINAEDDAAAAADDDLATVGAETRIALSVARALPAIRETVRSLMASSKKKLVAIVADLFGTDAFDVAEEFNVPYYLFFPSAAINLSVFLHMPDLDRRVSSEYRDMEELVKLPGCIPLQGRDLLDPLQDRKDDAYKWTLHHASRFTLAHGIMVNSFEHLEAMPLQALRQSSNGFPPVYPVGPLTQLSAASSDDNDDDDDKVDRSEDDDYCLKWLDNQPIGSVLFVSFGSGGTLSHEQLLEMAAGLELSGQRFIWVVRSPSKVANAAYFAQLKQDPFRFLPKGFIERVEGRGLVVPNWAPQAKVLRHDSTGGFLTHCGWNSTLESVACGVPLIAWPLYAEQRTNAVMLTEGLKVALRPKASENGLVESVEIARVVECLIQGEEGKQLRSRMRELKDAARKALSHDGSSTKSLVELASKWKSDIST